jgi:peptidoglycan/LPS O-acetylase OafA/YrhL
MLSIHVARKVVPGGSRLLVFTLAFPATILAASLSFSYFEKPVMNLKRFFIRKSPIEPPAPSAVS